eukprot:Gregarina_sp_Poly_1__9635@NODE_60_length_16930_cov_139_480579_g51_i0_p17_GENE_NODE_60_length_16930_cov_139_480579_g51_i0NODE_60_length_16930_cov_139_480579_g51_i0_p17_ORF_typecomplete_len103_score10_15_NODE_60_length_16930_cov_139_480579_g51_i01071911027
MRFLKASICSSSFEDKSRRYPVVKECRSFSSLCLLRVVTARVFLLFVNSINRFFPRLSTARFQDRCRMKPFDQPSCKGESQTVGRPAEMQTSRTAFLMQSNV